MPFVGPIATLIEELNRLPGIGPKSAQRLALHLLHRPVDEVRRLAQALVVAREQVRRCAVCADLTDQEICQICSDPRRDPSLLCVVESPKDVVALEKVRQYRGRYHVLHGAISPLEGIGPEDLTIRELLRRVEGGAVQELIIATDPDVEGEATALYLAKLVRPMGIRVTRIARGLPEGGDLDYADELTIARALEGRREI
ncbi:MAG: recombination protein RecR [Clostridia bacterium]|nr:recombination protein RecR [Clostridia bacterium]